ncbi:methyltransferase domain-containing protein [Micromonospora sp. NPDC050397]|uniref:methyltransferase domain-containing protein n=1 Tax=Micromonospora sp. NPDC050397 TaxID=3364279 RepID=UPI00385003EA
MTRPRPWEALDALPVHRAMRERSYHLLAPRPAGPVVDVGCGTGLALRELSDRGAEVIGVDPDPTSRAEAVRLRPGIEVRAGTAEELPFATGSAAGYRAERLFHLVTDPVAVLAEARRVLAPGAPMVLLTQDWAMATDDDSSPVAERIWRAATTVTPAPFAGRRSRSALLDAGFTDVSVEVVTAVLVGPAYADALVPVVAAARRSGTVSAAEADEWLAHRQRLARTGHGLLALSTFVVSGRSPVLTMR